MKIVALFLLVLLGCRDTFSFMSPPYYNPNMYNPGPGYLRPSYSFQQPSWGAPAAFPRPMPFQPQLRYTPPSNFGQQQSAGVSGFLTCTAMSCGTLKGFKQCLASPSSPYRYFIFHPQNIKDIRAYERLRAFTTVHPRCYAQFCNRVCSMVPPKFYPAAPQNAEQLPPDIPDDESVSDFSDDASEISSSPPFVEAETRAPQKASWFSRQRDWLTKNDRWKARQFEERASVQSRVEGLCRRNDIVGEEMRVLCSECAAYLKPDRQMIPACEKMIHYKPAKKAAATDRNQPQRVAPGRMGNEFDLGGAPDDNWGARDLAERQEEARLRLRAQNEQRALRQQQQAGTSRRGLPRWAMDDLEVEELGDPYLEPDDHWATSEGPELRRQDELRERLEEQREAEKKRRKEEKRQQEEAKKRQQQRPPSVEAEIDQQEMEDEEASETASLRSGSSQRSKGSMASSVSSHRSSLTAENLGKLPKGGKLTVKQWGSSVSPAGLQPASRKQAPRQSIAESEEDAFSEAGSLPESENDEDEE